MFNWRELLGLKPTVASFAQALIARARARGDYKWQFDAERSALRHAEDYVQIHLRFVMLDW